MEPINTAPKRLRIAKTGVQSGVNILSSANSLKIAKEERTQAGSFVEDDFVTELVHVNATLVGQLFDFFCADLETWLSGRLDNNVALPTRREFLNKLTGG